MAAGFVFAILPSLVRGRPSKCTMDNHSHRERFSPDTMIFQHIWRA